MATDWLARNDKIYAYTDGGKGMLVATVWAAPVNTNAKLIAAAPDLYDALQQLMARRTEHAVALAVDALQKANGTL